jgi:membrane metallo-endopeptidase-like protein 1
LQAYFEYMMDVAVLLGANPAAAEKEMTEVLLFEVAIANISLPRYTTE